MYVFKTFNPFQAVYVRSSRQLKKKECVSGETFPSPVLVLDLKCVWGLRVIIHSECLEDRLWRDLSRVYLKKEAHAGGDLSSVMSVYQTYQPTRSLSISRSLQEEQPATLRLC